VTVPADPATPPRIVLTSGEPAGIGPDLILMAAMEGWPAELVALGDRSLLLSRAAQLGLSVVLAPYTSGADTRPHSPGTLPLIDIALKTPCTPGVLDTANASNVLAQLEMAVEMCGVGECQAVVTAPVNKAVINEAGIPFSGHTEFLASATQISRPVMMLASDDLRVALATTHLPLRAVPDAINTATVLETIAIVDAHLKSHFAIAEPRITVLGLNPHAGENGHLGKEDDATVAPACEAARNRGIDVSGPLPADSAFIPSERKRTDAYLAMYHDQGLPVLKALGFHQAVNVTLGLPIIRTSVDHGTALHLAGTGHANGSSMKAAIATAIAMATTANC
jgi:4-hydroxythreonine-4-phosphate dehydrogenase